MPKENIESDSILVAIDGSNPAQVAAGVAVQIAQSLKLKVHGLYVVDESIILNSYSGYKAELGIDHEPASQAELVDLFEQKGNALLQWLENLCVVSKVPVKKTELVFGGIPEIVLQQADHVRMLALGRRGLSHAQEPSHLGGNFRAIAHRASIPLVVGGDTLTSIKRLLLAYNGRDGALNALQWALRLKRSLNGELIVLSVEEMPEEEHLWLSDIQASLERSELGDYRFIGKSGDPAEQIVAVADEIQADLVIMGGFTHPALLEWLIGGVLDKVLRHISVPMLMA